MGGFVAIALKQKGKTTTRIVPKYAAAGLTRGDFFEGHGLFWDEWKEGEKHTFVPYGYGLVVIDLDKKWAAGIQNYCDFDEAGVRLSRPKDIEDFERLWGQGRVKKVAAYSSSGDIPISFPGGKKNCTFEQLMQRINNLYSDSGTLMVQVKPPKGWKIEEMSNDEAGWSELVASLKDRGFEIKVGEVSKWEAYLQEKIGTTSPMDALLSERAALHIEKATQPARAPSRSLRI